MTAILTPMDETRTQEIERVCQLGIPLLRLYRNTKKPVGEGWQLKANYGLHPTAFSFNNIGLLLGHKIKGTDDYAFVIDVDRKSDGYEKLKLLEEELGELPETFEIKTGDGGVHKLYKSKTLYRPTKKLPPDNMGVEFLSKGNFAVTAGSIHPDTRRMYQINIDEPIADLPEKWGQRIEGLTNGKGGKDLFFDGSKDGSHFSDIEKVRDGNRDNYLTQIAGALRGAGLGHEAIELALMQHNQDKCEPPKSAQSVKRIAKSIMRYQPRELLSGIVPLAQPESKPKAVKKAATAFKGEKFNLIYEGATGGIKQIADHILAHSQREWPHFAIAAATSIVSAFAQGAYHCPPMSDQPEDIGPSLNTYFWLIAPSGAGKDAYLRGVKYYVQDVARDLYLSAIGSSEGLHRALFTHNSRLAVIDEMQDEMHRMENNTNLLDVSRKIKELANGLDRLDGRTLSKFNYPDIVNPRLSIFSSGTISGFRNHLSTQYIEGGGLSRFHVLPALDIPKKKWPPGPKMRSIPDEIRDLLTRMRKGGLTEHGATEDPVADAARYATIGEPNIALPVVHEPQWDPYSGSMRIEPSALKLWATFGEGQENLYRDYVRDENSAPGSVAERAAMFAYRAAALHCLGRSEQIVTDHDMEFGILWAKIQSNWLIKDVTRNQGDDPLNKFTNRIAGFFKDLEPGTMVSRKQIYAICNRHVKSAMLNDILESLILMGEIGAVGSATGQPFAITGDMPKTGISFVRLE